MSKLKRLGSVVAVLSLTLAGAVVAAPTASAYGKGDISLIYPERATSKKSKGGFYLPFAMPCSDDDYYGPTVRTTVRNKAGHVVAKATTPDGSLPDAVEIRLKPGTYRISTTATCSKKRKATRRQTIKVGVKTDASTISRSEYGKLKKGMTKAKVKKIVGTLGDTMEDSSVLERTAYDRYSMIQWTNSGRIAHKWWGAPID